MRCVGLPTALSPSNVKARARYERKEWGSVRYGYFKNVLLLELLVLRVTLMARWGTGVAHVSWDDRFSQYGIKM